MSQIVLYPLRYFCITLDFVFPRSIFSFSASPFDSIFPRVLFKFSGGFLLALILMVDQKTQAGIHPCVFPRISMVYVEAHFASILQGNNSQPSWASRLQEGVMLFKPSRRVTVTKGTMWTQPQLQPELPEECLLKAQCVKLNGVCLVRHCGRP